MKKYIFTLIFLLSHIILFAQRQYNLQECLETTIANNYDLLHTEYQKDYDKVLQKSASGAYFPNVTGNASYSRSINNTTNQLIDLNQLSFSLNANLLIFDGGGRNANYRNANNAAKLTELRKQYLTEQLKLQVYTQFINILKLQEIIIASQEDIKVSTSQLENSNARYAAGVVPYEAVLSQEAELGNKELTLLSQQIELNTAKQALLITMGQNPIDSVGFRDSNISSSITDSNISNFNSSVGDLQSSIGKAFKNRIDYSSYITNQTIAQANLDASTGGYYPTLSANFNYGYQGWGSFNSDKLNGSVGLNLNIPIFNNFSTDLSVQQSELSLQQENTNILKLEQSIKAEVQTAYFNLQSAEKAINIAKKSFVAAEQNFKTVQEKLNLGSATITDYITANSQFVTAQLNVITAGYTYLSTQKNLLFTIGIY